MAAIWNGLKQATRLIWQPTTASSIIPNSLSPWKPQLLSARLYCYNPYPQYEDPGTPYRPKRPRRFGYIPKYYQGGKSSNA